MIDSAAFDSPEASRSASGMGALPIVTVIMPIRNESGFIARSLGAVMTQDYPHHLLEVLVADGQSTDDTREIVMRLSRDHSDISLTIVDNPQKIVPTGFNLALLRARGEIIVRVDGHTIIAPDYVRQCVAALHRWGADNAGGRMDAVGDGDFAKVVALATSTPFGVGGARFHYSDREEWVDTVYMGAWPREVFERIGLFDEEQVRNQDDEFNYRLQARGGRVLLCPAIRSRYFNRSTPAALWRQYYQYGYWKVRVMQKHPRQMRPRQFVPALFVFGLLVTLAMAPFSMWSGVAFLAVAAAYISANLLASIWTARRGSWRHLPKIIMAFATIHFSYGLGFLAGLVRFRGRWRDRGSWKVLAPRGGSTDQSRNGIA